MAHKKAEIKRESEGMYLLKLFQCPKCIRGKPRILKRQYTGWSGRKQWHGFRGIRCNARGCNFRVLSSDPEMALLHWNHNDLREPQPKKIADLPPHKHDDRVDAFPYLLKMTWHDMSDGKPVDPVNHAAHWAANPDGVECIQVTRHLNFNIGNAIKYLWRADKKGKTIEDMNKALWYIMDEIQRQGGMFTRYFPALRIHSRYVTPAAAEASRKLRNGGAQQ